MAFRHQCAALAACGALFGAVAPAHADGFRCGTRLVLDGVTQSQVRNWCGEPTDVSRRSIWRPAVIWRYGRPYHLGGDIEVPVETWTYNLGPSKLMRRIRFEDGEVVEIETLGYGYHEREPQS